MRVIAGLRTNRRLYHSSYLLGLPNLPKGAQRFIHYPRFTHVSLIQWYSIGGYLFTVRITDERDAVFPVRVHSEREPSGYKQRCGNAKRKESYGKTRREGELNANKIDFSERSLCTFVLTFI